MQAFWRPRPVQQHNTQQFSLQQQQQDPQTVSADPQQRQLGSDQQRAVAAVLQGDCVFLTGGAGVGKSFTVAEVVRALQARGKVVAVTASTGTAAVNVDGMTLHSWAGILDVNQHMVRLAETLWEWDKFREQWKRTDVLLVDEVSMVGADVIEKVDYLAKYLRGWRISPHTELPGVEEVHELHPEPFGGLQVVSVGDFFQLPPVDKDNTSTITINSGHAPPANASGRARFQQQQQQQQRDEDEDDVAKVPVIVAVLPPGFITAAAAARRFMGTAAAGGAAAAVSTTVAAAASPLPATAGAAGYPNLGALQGGFLGPVQVAMQPQQQQQQRVKAQVVDLQSSRRQQQQIIQIKPQLVDMLASPLTQQQRQQRWQRVEAGEVVDRPASSPKQRQQQQGQAETVDLLDSGDEDSRPRLQQQQQQHRRRSAEAMELGLDQLDMSPSKRQRSALKQELDSTRLAATAADVVAAAAVALPEDAGVDTVRPFGKELPAAAAAALDSLEPAVPAVSPLPDAAAARGACGDSSGAAAAATTPSGFSRLALTSPTSSSSSSRIQPGCGLLCSPAAAAAAAAAGAVDEPKYSPAAYSAAAGAGAVDIDSFEMVPGNDAESDSDCVIVDAEHDVIDLSMSQPDQQLQQPLPAALAAESVQQQWQIVQPGQPQGMMIDLSASQPDEQQQQQGAATGGLQQQQQQHPPLVIKQDPQQQQQQHQPPMIKQDPQQQQQQQQHPPLMIKQDAQQQQGWQGWSGVLPQVKKQSPPTTATPNSLYSPRVQPHSAAAAAVGAADHHSSSSVQGIDGPYTLHGKHPFRRVLQGRVYAAEPGPGLNNRLNPRCSNSIRMRGIASLAPQQQGWGSSTPAAAAAAAGDSGPRLPTRWLKGFRPKDYCFKSPVWAAAGFKPIILKKPYRQSEARLLDMLDKVRYGNFDWSVQQMLHQELQKPLDEGDGIKPTELFPTNKQVERLNAAAYSLLPGPELKTVCCDRCEPQGAVSCDFMAKQLDQNTNAQQSLDLKPGAQVVLLWNLEVGAGLANGTRGVVEGFRGIREYLSQEGVSVQDDQSVGRPTDIGAGCHHSNCSCQAGYCIHQHQQQQQRPGARVGNCGLANCPCGMDDWSKGKSGGSFFVRLPDAAEGVTIVLPDSMPAFRRLQMQNAISWLNHTDTTQLPYVKFSKPPRDANNPHIPNPCRIIGPQTWTHRRRVRAYRGQRPVKVALTRTALPLRLAWALTVHRSQGMSITKLRVHLGKAFGPGMVYVALSRCVSLDGLQVIGRVKAPETDADVLQFYKYIERIEATEL